MSDYNPSESIENAGIPNVFPIFVLHDWNKRSAEARSSHCAVLPYVIGYISRFTTFWGFPSRNARIFSTTVSSSR